MMNILDKFQKFSTIDKDPDWLCSASPVQQRLYVEAKKQYEEKKALIESGNASDVKSRKIIASAVAEAAMCDKSNISKRKNPDLHKWIEDKTEELISLAQSQGLHHKSRRRTTEEVRQENNIIKRQLKAERNFDYAAIAESLLSNTLIESHKNISNELVELRKENQYLHNLVAELRQSNRLLMSSINVGKKNK